MQKSKLYVGNFPYSCTEDQLRAVFSEYGQITDLAMIMDRETGRPKGFAFVTFASAQAAEKALEQNGRDLGGRPLKVNMALERDNSSRGPRPGGFGGAGRGPRY